MLFRSLIPPLCPPNTPTKEELEAKGAVGAAAAIQADEAGAAQRRAAVRYLGTVDCHYWPEAEDALIGALRTETRAEFAEVRGEMARRFEAVLDQKIDRHFTWLVGIQVAVLVAVVGALVGS